MEYGHARSPTAGSLRSRPPLPNGPRTPSKPLKKNSSVIPLDLSSRLEDTTSAYSDPPSSLSRTSSPFASSFSFTSDRPNSSEVSAEKLGTSEKGVQTSAGDLLVPESARASSPAVKIIPKTPSLTPPPALNFESTQVAWKGLTLEAAKWTFTSEELQQIVSGAIRKSASESFIRLVPLKTADEELIAELDRLDSLKGTTQSQYRFNMHKRTMLLQSLNALSCSAGAEGDAEALINLTKQLADLTMSCDRLMETLVNVADQRAQIQRIQDIHIASALAMGLRKLNDSYRRRTTELQEAKSKIKELRAELEEAWEVAQDMAQEMDDLDNFHSGFSDDEDEDTLDYPAPSVHSAQIIEITGTAVASKAMLVESPKPDSPPRSDRISRVLSAKKRSSRASKASLRIPKSPSSGAADRVDRASIMSRRSRSKSLRRRSTVAEEIPEVPAIQIDPASQKEDSFLEMGETRPVSPMTSASATTPDIPPLPTPSAFENKAMRQFLGNESPTLSTAVRAPLPPSPGFDHTSIPRHYTAPADRPKRRPSSTARRVQSVPSLSHTPRITDSLIDVRPRPSTGGGKRDSRPLLDAPIWRRYTVPVMAVMEDRLPAAGDVRPDSRSSIEAHGSHQSISGD
ncbi:hypothetical protein OBBRIDRAFT_152444 [Obba rivulosa]|uniref:Uncharacterized protein n=1 Tax=Obba rivulosa TaxID=1052685 RepID=A0A8E2AT52_9APHY|nr:hypothetical protein OBBRIDRAFT_152444 [Obba rivulosa]